MVTVLKHWNILFDFDITTLDRLQHSQTHTGCASATRREFTISFIRKLQKVYKRNLFTQMKVRNNAKSQCLSGYSKKVNQGQSYPSVKLENLLCVGKWHPVWVGRTNRLMRFGLPKTSFENALVWTNKSGIIFSDVN